jgi:hypothetical protein
MPSMNEVIEFFRQQDWLANALGIVTVLGGLALFVWKWIVPKIWAPKIESVIPSQFEETWSASNGKQIATVAIVDDQPRDFPIAELKQDGFNITSYKQVHLADVPKLATYDIVFLDMKGIVKDDPEYGGLKLIAELRKTSPTQKICAVSSKTFDPTATEFFKQADNYKKKPLTAQECKAVIESFIQQIFSVSSAIENAKEAVSGMPPKRRKAVLQEFSRSLSRRESADSMDSAFALIGVSQEERRVLGLLFRMIRHAG